MVNEIQINIDVIIAKKRGNSLYFLEILNQIGLFYHAYLLEDFIKTQANPDKWSKMVILTGAITVSAQFKPKLEKFIKNGGALLVVGYVQGISDLLGIRYRIPNAFPFPVGGIDNISVGDGFLLQPTEPIFKDLSSNYFPLHGFGCVPVKTAGATPLAQYQAKTPAVPMSSNKEIVAHSEDPADDRWPAITFQSNGHGSTLFIAIDIPRTLRFIQEGRYIDRDGIPPADGMAPIDDDILKCEDGLVLDWVADRRSISPKYQVPAFMVPVCDVWRQIIALAIEFLAKKCAIPLTRIKPWPKGKEFIALISHDTDGNNENDGRNMLARVNALGIHTTWCIIPPGYSPKLCNEIRSGGHELAFHFDAQSYNLPDIFSFDTLKEQVEEVSHNSQIPSFYSNKNHYTRWERRTDFFQWLVKLGFKVDQSKGPSKCGTLGFPFGTCFPWFPMDNEGNLIECMEIGFVSQDFGLQGPEDCGSELIDACRLAGGVCHIIFHPAHVGKVKVKDAMEKFVQEVKDKGGLFMRSDEIGQWILQRRTFIQAPHELKIDNAVIESLDPGTGLWKLA